MCLEFAGYQLSVIDGRNLVLLCNRIFREVLCFWAVLKVNIVMKSLNSYEFVEKVSKLNLAKMGFYRGNNLLKIIFIIFIEPFFYIIKLLENILQRLELSFSVLFYINISLSRWFGRSQFRSLHEYLPELLRNRLFKELNKWIHQ